MRFSQRRFFVSTAPARSCVSTLLKTLIAISTFVAATKAAASPRSAIYEEAYCSTERNREVRVERSHDEIPRVERDPLGAPVIWLDYSALQRMGPDTARFLFTRACFEASVTTFSTNLECDTLDYIAQHYKTGFHVINPIGRDLLRMGPEGERIAESLYRCLR